MQRCIAEPWKAAGLAKGPGSNSVRQGTIKAGEGSPSASEHLTGCSPKRMVRSKIARYNVCDVWYNVRHESILPGSNDHV